MGLYTKIKNRIINPALSSADADAHLVTGIDYREALFQELLEYSHHKKHYNKILEIGPKDGLDSKRLSSLYADELCLVDLPYM